MFTTRYSLAAGVVVGGGLTLLAGWAGSIGLVEADDGVPVPATVPAVVVQSPPSIESSRAVEAVALTTSPARAAAPIDPTPVELRAIEPTGAPEAAPFVVDRLVLVGDSLAEATAPVIRYVTPGVEFVVKFWGGTAPCDWLDDDLEATASSVVVITFTGNNLTPCMLDESGAKLIDQPLVDTYRADVGVLIERATAAGARVVLVGQPLRHPSFDAELEVEGINAVYREFAAALSGVSYVDAGRFVETPDGGYTDRLPCSELDIDCAVDGTTVVRGDGVHFCPVVDAVPCPVWSSGAVRFGLGIASAAADPARFE